MARTDKYSIQKGTLDDIADAIREKRGHSNSMSPTAMPNEIRAIESGGGGSPITVGFDKGFTEYANLWYYGNNSPVPYSGITNYIRDSSSVHYDSIVDFYNVDPKEYCTGDDNSCIMLFYQTSNSFSGATPWIGVHVEADGNWEIKRYTTDNGTGNTILDNSNVYNYSGSATFRKNLTLTYSNNSGPRNSVDIWIITGENIKYFGFATSTDQAATSRPNNDQPCICKFGDLPQVESLYSEPGSTDPTKYCWSTKHLAFERVTVGYDSPVGNGGDGGNSTGVRNIKNAWKDSHSLITLETMICATPPPDWYGDDTHTAPLDASHLFENCYNLRYAPLSGIFASWVGNYLSAPISDMSYMFNNCYMLKTIVLDGASVDGSGIAFSTYTYFDETSGEDVFLSPQVSLSHFCNNCYSLEKICADDMSGQEISFGDLSYAFNNCYSLTDINSAVFIPMENWTLSYITSYSHTFANCYSLTTIDAWIDSGAYTNLSAVDYMFYNCRSLTKLGPESSNSGRNTITVYISQNSLENYNGVSNFDHMFDGCTSLTNMAIPFTIARHPSGLVSMSYMFANCTSLETVDLTEWSYLNDNYSVYDKPDYPLKNNDKVKDISYMFYNCWSLKYTTDSLYGNSNRNYKNSFRLEDSASGWDICVWDHAFENCYSIEEMDLSRWDGGYQHVYPNASCNYTVTYTDAFKNMYKLKSLNLPGHLNLSNGGTGLSLTNCPGLMYYSGYSLAFLSHGYYGCDNLTRQSLVLCINKLETVNATQTLTIGLVNLAKLDASDIAVATQKGWTVA